MHASALAFITMESCICIRSSLRNTSTVTCQSDFLLFCFRSCVFKGGALKVLRSKTPVRVSIAALAHRRLATGHGWLTQDHRPGCLGNRDPKDSQCHTAQTQESHGFHVLGPTDPTAEATRRYATRSQRAKDPEWQAYEPKELRGSRR